MDVFVRAPLRPLRFRRRLMDIGSRAINRWMDYWGCSWVRLPTGHASKRLLSEQPSAVPLGSDCLAG